MTDRPLMRDRLLIGGLRLLPKSAWSRFVGALTHAPMPRPLATMLIKGFARLYDINLDEVEQPIKSFPHLGAFFIRALKDGARPLDLRPGVAISPADGHILNAGRITEGRLVQAKGRAFTVGELLGDEALNAVYEGGAWVTVYLSPQDYHRVHHPVEGRITAARYIPGHLWPVNRAGVQLIDRLFCVNERLITFVDGPFGQVATVMVGATSVGRISAAYDPTLETNRGRPAAEQSYEDTRVARGDELGAFHLGSTAVVLFSSKAIELEPLEAGAEIKLGHPIARRRDLMA
ncbi:phosphatidylserine decarboxylase [Myxococcota bacterium]|nr:phosphatidylserine decarboxylase [Myxococcota bacterium]MBU1897507.1 phosphatidylserine decarboxylase [Myxococcota bacterium]